MRFVILGAGAMGSYFGACLTRSGQDVALLDVEPGHIGAIQERGLNLEKNGVFETVHMEAAVWPEEIAPGDYLIVFTKANKVLAALAGVSGLVAECGATIVLSNGLGIGEAVAPIVPVGRLLHGTTASGAVLVGPGHIRFTVEGNTYIGPLKGPVPECAFSLAAAFEAAGLPVTVTDRVEEYIWTKLMVNVGYNALTALTGVTNGEAVKSREGRLILEGAVCETLEVAKAKGIRIHYDDAVRFVVDLGLGIIGPNRSSMLQDVMRRRETEVKWLNGAVVAEGDRLGVPTNVNRLLTALVTVLQEGFNTPLNTKTEDQASGPKHPGNSRSAGG
jgi:2-dehydropantoate 2-reductase